MRLLFSTTGGAGHFGPLAPIARACVAAGHEVRVAAPASFAGQVAEAGLAHAPFADVPPEVMGPVFGSLGSMSMEDANATVVREIFGRLDAQAALPGMREIVSGWRPDVILREPSEFAAAAMAEHEAIPHAEVAIGMSSMVEWASVHVADPLGELDDLVGLERGRTVAALAGAPVFSSVPASVDEARGLEWKAVRSMSPADGAGPSADGQESPAGRPAPTTDGGGSPAKGGRSSSDGAGSPAAAGPVGSAVRQTWRYRDADGPGRQGSLPAAWGDSGRPWST